MLGINWWSYFLSYWWRWAKHFASHACLGPSAHHPLRGSPAAWTQRAMPTHLRKGAATLGGEKRGSRHPARLCSCCQDQCGAARAEGSPWGSVAPLLLEKPWSSLKQYSKKETILVRVKRWGQRQVVWSMGPLRGECPWLLNPWTATLIKLPLAVALFWKLRCGLQNENASGLWVREDLFPVAYNLVHLN